MECKEIKNKLYFYFEQELLEAEAEAVAAHLQTCARCKAIAHAMQVTLEAEPPAMQVPPGFLFKVSSRLRGNLPPRSKERRWAPALLPVLKPVAVALLLAFSTFLGRWLADDRGSEMSTEAQLLQFVAENEVIAVLDTESQTSLVAAYISVME